MYFFPFCRTIPFFSILWSRSELASNGYKFVKTKFYIMPKQGNDNLFRLIKSLSKTEKAYFTKFAERHVIGEKNNYLKLFDAIDKQTVYDEKKMLREEKYIKQLPYLKNYLMDIILKSLQVFYSDHTQEHRVRRMLDDAWLLNKKGLYDLCYDVLEKIKKESYNTISGSAFMDAARLEERVFAITGDIKRQKEGIEITLPEEREILNDLLWYNEIASCYQKIYLY